MGFPRLSLHFWRPYQLRAWRGGGSRACPPLLLWSWSGRRVLLSAKSFQACAFLVPHHMSFGSSRGRMCVSLKVLLVCCKEMPFAPQLTSRCTVGTPLPALPTSLHRAPQTPLRKAPCCVAQGSQLPSHWGLSSAVYSFTPLVLPVFPQMVSVVCCVLDMARDAGCERNVQNGPLALGIPWR